MIRTKRGFTLIELMITVAIVGILAAIAYPSYQDQVMKSRRGEAKACLMEMAQFMERFYTTNGRYDLDSGGAAVALPVTQCVNDLQVHYVIALAGVAPQTYTLTATPINTQAAQDTRCAVLGIDQTGRKTFTGTGTAAQCW